jgi:hypothetical protein
MTGAADLEIDLILTLEENFAVIEPPRSVHQAESLYKLFWPEAGGTGGIEPFGSGGRTKRRYHQYSDPH